jgi:hypothetical protein
MDKATFHFSPCNYLTDLRVPDFSDLHIRKVGGRFLFDFTKPENLKFTIFDEKGNILMEENDVKSTVLICPLPAYGPFTCSVEIKNV